MLIGYARVSTRDQNPDLQLDALGEAGCGKIFTEQRSGARRDRPELAKALAYVRAGDVLVTWMLDRLARSLRQLIETVGRLEEAEIGFRSLTEAIDTTTPGGRLVFHIFGSLSQFEREIIRERTIAGLDAARARGRRGGRPAKLGAKEVEAARAMLVGSGLTFAEVAAQLGVGRSTLYRHLRDAGWEGKDVTKAVMRQALEDDMEAREDVYRRLAAS